MAFPIPTFRALLELEPHGADVYVGLSPAYPWGRVYGGQVVAQALWAAAATVDRDHYPHSLHAYFIRGGDYDEPIRYEVDRIRNGRSFLTRRVVARQSAGAILNLSASFHVLEDEVDAPYTEIDPQATVPTDGGEVVWSKLLRRVHHADEPGSARSAAWLKVTDELGDDPFLQACGLAYLSDDLPTMAVAKAHPVATDAGPSAHNDTFQSASLDHAIWFHRRGRADEWQLQDFRAHGVSGGRGLAIGEVFDQTGVHLATVSQEVLMRARTQPNSTTTLP